MDHKHTGDDGKDEKKADTSMPDASVAAATETKTRGLRAVTERDRRMSVFLTELARIHGGIERHLSNFAHMSMPEPLLTRDEALDIWLKLRHTTLNVAHDGYYSAAELVWLTLCLQHVASKEPRERQRMTAAHLLGVFKEMCVLGRRAVGRDVGTPLVETVFDRAAAVFHAVLYGNNVDELLVKVGADFDPSVPGIDSVSSASSSSAAAAGTGAGASAAPSGKDEKKATATDTVVGEAAGATGTTDQKRTMDMATLRAAKAGNTDDMDPDSKRLHEERLRQMATSPLDQPAKAVQGFVIYGARIFFNVWARFRVQKMFGDFGFVDVAEADCQAFRDYVGRLSALEPMQESTNAVVNLFMRQNCMVGALAFYRRTPNTANAQMPASSLIQGEISVDEYNELSARANELPHKIWADPHHPVRECLCVETFARQVSFQAVRAQTATGLGSELFRSICVLQDELVDRVDDLQRKTTGMRPRSPILVQLPGGWAVHDRGRFWVQTSTGGREKDHDFVSTAVLWLRLMQSKYNATLTCGTRLHTLIRDFGLTS